MSSMIVMGDAMAHIEISTETIYDSAQSMRRLAHELLELVRLRDKVRRAEARQKARGKFGPRDQRKRVRHVLKIRYRLFRANSSESLLATTAKCLHRELQWLPALDLKCLRCRGGEIRCQASDRLLETFDSSHLLSALTVQPGRASNDNPFSN
jgi:hypothetical protein